MRAGEIDLPARGLFDAHAWWSHAAARAVPGMEEAGPGWVRRPVPGPRGPVVVAVHVAAGGDADPHGAAVDGAASGATGRARVIVEAGQPGGALEDVVPAIRRWLALDDDPAPAVSAWATDPVLGRAVGRRPGLRVHGAVDPAELALRTVLGQQVSVAGARTLTGRLVALLGPPVPASSVSGSSLPGPPLSGVLRAFPAPADVAAAGVEAVRSIGLTGARATTLVTLAAALADGLDVGPGAGLAGRLRELLALPGIGPWTVAYVALRAAGDPDAFPAHDLVLRQALAAAGSGAAARPTAATGAYPAPAVAPGISARAAELAAETWRPHRALAAQHLWTAAALDG